MSSTQDDAQAKQVAARVLEAAAAETGLRYPDDVAARSPCAGEERCEGDHECEGRPSQEAKDGASGADEPATAPRCGLWPAGRPRS